MVLEQLDEAVLKHGHEDVHGCHQRLSLFWFLISESNMNVVLILPQNMARKREQKTSRMKSQNSLVVFDELVEAKQDAQPG